MDWFFWILHGLVGPSWWELSVVVIFIVIINKKLGSPTHFHVIWENLANCHFHCPCHCHFHCHCHYSSHSSRRLSPQGCLPLLPNTAEEVITEHLQNLFYKKKIIFHKKIPDLSNLHPPSGRKNKQLLRRNL